MSSFGDVTEEDSYDPTAPADPEAVARILVNELRARITSGPARPELYDELPDIVKAAWAFAFAALLLRLRREGGLR